MSELNRVPDNWIAVAGSLDIEENCVAPVVVSGKELAVWRDGKGRVHANSNFCVHRGMRLSHGFIKDDRLICRYHGWRYNSEGKCDYIPALPDTKPAPAHCVKNYSVCESDGLVWVSLEGEKDSVKPIFEKKESQFCRSIYLKSSLENVTGKVACFDILPSQIKGEVKEINLDFKREKVSSSVFTVSINGYNENIIIAVQPIADEKIAIHISVNAEDYSDEVRMHYAQWAKTLRMQLETES